MAIAANGWQQISIVPALKSSITTYTHSVATVTLWKASEPRLLRWPAISKLPNLCWIYDNNRITLDGPADWSFTEDVAQAL